MNSNSVAREACLLHANPNVTQRIKELQTENYKRNKATIDELVNVLSGMVRFDIADLYDDDGNLMNIKEMPLIARQMISELTSDEIKIGGESVGQVKKVKTIAKLDAVEKLMKHLGGYEKDNSQKSAAVTIFQLPDNDRK
jgi:phage terminase small subunit